MINKNKYLHINSANIIAFVFAFVFILSLILCYFYVSTSKNTKIESFNNLVLKFEKYQLDYNIIKNPSSKPTTSIIYNNGKEAIISGFEKLNNIKNWEIEINGTLTATLGISLEVTLNMKIRKQNNVFEHEIYLYNNSNPMFNSAQYGILKDGIVHECYSQNLWLENNKICSDVKNKPCQQMSKDVYTSYRGNAPGELLYVINEKSVKNTSNFYIKKNLSNEISFYYTDFTLDPNLSTYKYILFLKDKLHGGKNFNYNKINACAIFDSAGRVSCLEIFDNYTFVYPISFIDTNFKVSSYYIAYFKY